MMKTNLELAQVRAYINALWALGRGGSTFTEEAGKMRSETIDSDTNLFEFFGKIEDRPV